ALAGLLVACGAPDLVGGEAARAAPVVPPVSQAPPSRDPMPNALPADPAQPPRVMGPNTVYFEYQVEEPVRPVDGTRGPLYPPEARAARREGEVLVQFVVDTAGRVESSTIEILRADAPDFAAAVRETLPGMRFHPGRVGGRPVKQLVQQPFAFRLSR
ncbi:energy transducer TonB, partial [Roseisolibacter sp. H3M3-2]|uniref:energy transducer TonB n=1 Tax=Roseisolibacter sp. H3M3-2 TaxID=3031323 RepID=UPI0023DA6A32